MRLLLTCGEIGRRSCSERLKKAFLLTVITRTIVGAYLLYTHLTDFLILFKCNCSEEVKIRNEFKAEPLFLFEGPLLLPSALS